MKIEDLRVGMRVMVNSTGNHTRATQGFDYEMENFLGTQRTIGEVSFHRGNIMFEEKSFYWDPRDIREIPNVDEQKIILKGEKQLFNVDELT